MTRIDCDCDGLDRSVDHAVDRSKIALDAGCVDCGSPDHSHVAKDGTPAPDHSGSPFDFDHNDPDRSDPDHNDPDPNSLVVVDRSSGRRREAKKICCCSILLCCLVVDRLLVVDRASPGDAPGGVVLPARRSGDRTWRE